MLTFFANYDTSNCTYYPTISWESCNSGCLTNSSCFYALRTSSSSCGMCGYGSFTNIIFSETETDNILSVKSDATNCSDSFQYLITQQIDHLKICQNGWVWEKLYRFNHTLCSVWLYYPYFVSFTDASTYCQKYGGEFLGLQTDAERHLFASVNNLLYKGLSSGWISLKRTNGVWSYIDSWLFGNGSIVWAEGHPITGYDCASLQLGTGLIQSENCSATDCLSTYCPTMILCGKLIQ